MSCTRVDHAGVAVENLMASVKWYGGTLGLYSKGTEVVQEQQMTVAFLPCGGSELELLENISPEDPIARFIEKDGKGIQHIAIRVNDVDTALTELRGKGVRFIDQTPRHGVGGAWIAFFHPRATHDVLLGLCEGK